MENKLTPEQLLNPRYKVIAEYPGCQNAIGDILYKYTFPETGNYCYVTNVDILLLGNNLRPDEVEKHPHLFKKLEWWEDRRAEDMPEYVRAIRTGKCYKVADKSQDRRTWHEDNEIEHRFVWNQHLGSTYIPITEEEYLNSLTQQKKDNG